EQGGAMVPPVMVRFAGDAGDAAFGNRVIQPYVRHSQQTTNPPITLFDFGASATNNTVEGMYELAEGSSGRQIASTGGEGNIVSDMRGAILHASGVSARNGNVAIASLTQTTQITTDLADIVFNNTVSDPTSRYDAGLGEYDVGDSPGVYRVAGLLTANSPSSNRSVTMHLRVGV